MDPVLRCDSCNKLVWLEKIHKSHFCPYCGNKRFRSMLNFSQIESDEMKDKGVDPEFLALFEEVPDEG